MTRKIVICVVITLLLQISMPISAFESGILSDSELKAGDPVYYSVGDISFTMRYAPAADFPVGIYDMDKAVVEQGFLIAETQVTYELWYLVRMWAEEHGYIFENVGSEGGGSNSYSPNIGGTPSLRKNEPVTLINWYDGIVWTNALSELLGYDPVYTYDGEVFRDATNRFAGDNVEQTNRNGFRVPTSDEWELAARYIDGQSWTPGNCASGASEPAWIGHVFYGKEGNVKATQEVAWYFNNLEHKTHDVGKLQPNGLGIYDMSGNVYEMCFDWNQTFNGNFRIIRGGSWRDHGANMRIGRVSHTLPWDTNIMEMGIRLVRTPLD